MRFFPKNNNKKLKRILAVKLADFGDALLIEPSLRTLHKIYPEAKLDVLTTKNALAALERLPYLNRVILFDKYQFDSPRAAFSFANIKSLAKFALQLAGTRYDAVIFFHHLTTRWGALKFAALAVATLSPIRAGLDNQTGRAWFLNKTIADNGFGYAGKSESDYWRELVETLVKPSVSDLSEAEQQPIFMLKQEERAEAQKWPVVQNKKFNDRPLIAIYPGSGDYALSRRWLPVNFADVAVSLIKEFNADIVLVGSKSEYGISEQVQALMRGHSVTIATGQTSLHEAAAILETCDLFIGNDGGLMHLAAALNVPVVAIFGPTNAAAWRPYGWQSESEANAVIVQANIDLPCRPCLYQGKELGHRLGCMARPCLNTITAKQVISASRQILTKNLKPASPNYVD